MSIKSATAINECSALCVKDKELKLEKSAMVTVQYTYDLNYSQHWDWKDA